MQDGHFVHVLQAIADLPDEHHSIQLHQSVVFINNPVKQLASGNAEGKDEHMKSIKRNLKKKKKWQVDKICKQSKLHMKPN